MIDSSNLLNYSLFFNKNTSSSWGGFDEYNRIFFKSAENYIADYLRARGFISWEKINNIFGMDPDLNDLDKIKIYRYKGKVIKLKITQITYDVPSYEIGFMEA